MIEPRRKARILVLDIETAPNLIYTWGTYQQDMVGMHTPWYILSFAAKWVGEGKIISRGLPDYAGYRVDKKNDRKLVLELSHLLALADIVVAHNGAEFDLKRIKTRMLFHGFPPLPPYKLVDTYKASQMFAPYGNNGGRNLATLVEYTGLGRKMETGGFSLWVGCMEGSKSAWDKMLKYNRHDVHLTDKLYRRLRPWIPHPNVNLYGYDRYCSRCGHSRLAVNRLYYASTKAYNRLVCLSCGGWMRMTEAIKSIRRKNT